MRFVSLSCKCRGEAPALVCIGLIRAVLEILRFSLYFVFHWLCHDCHDSVLLSLTIILSWSWLLINPQLPFVQHGARVLPLRALHHRKLSTFNSMPLRQNPRT